ncbi:hypothetical protein DB345_02490 [Spartobacteria bacterium LR76]|nr:hypothetical protein DB345_02490 [Spartobacteria bacterium LR76]
MFSPFFPPALWQMALSLAVFLAVWCLGRRRPWTWRVNLALLLIAAMPLAVAVGWFHWYCDTMGRAGYTGPVDPFTIEQIQEGSILRSIFLSSTMGALFFVRGLILLRQKAMAGTLTEDGHEC